MNNQILVNMIQTPDGTILQSYNRHDYKTYKDSNGFTYMVDGGTAYLRRNVNTTAPHQELSLYVGDSHDRIRDTFMWGSYGKDADQPLSYIRLKDMDVEHINAILETQLHIPDYINQVFEDELQFRSN